MPAKKPNSVVLNVARYVVGSALRTAAAAVLNSAHVVGDGDAELVEAGLVVDERHRADVLRDAVDRVVERRQAPGRVR